MGESIYISSSDDDELEEIDVQQRTLPQWATTFERSSDYGRRNNSSRGSNSSNLSSSSVYNNSQIKPHTLPVSSTNALNHRIARRDERSYHAQNGNTSQQQTVNSQISKSHGEDYEKMSSQQAFKRTLPSTLQPSATRALPSPLFVSDIRSSNLKDNPGSSHLHDAYKNHRQGVGPSMSRDIRDSVIRGHDEGHLLNQNSGNRILPPSLVLGKAITPHFAISSESAYHSGIGDERSAENDERLIYEAALQDISQPKTEYELPAGVLSVSLLRHQKIALAWMLQRETKSLHCLGGILADDQGLGKTVSMISLILALRSLQTKSKTDDVHNHKTEALNLDDDDDNGGIDVEKHKNSVEDDGLFPNREPSCSTQAPGRKRPAAGTLVVCPASVMRQWARELDEKVGDEKLSVLVYHGGNRTKDHVELAKFDVVLTTYSIVTNEVPKQPLVGDDDIEDKNGERFGLSSEFTVKKRKKPINGSKKGKKGRKGIDSSREYGSGPLAKVGWFRVILDEAQTIKNHRTQVARACCSLRAKRRWCLSGTPIQNTIDDLYSYFRFLKYDPYAAYKSFYNTIKVPIARDTIHGYKKLQAVLKAIMLRRTKGTLLDGMPIINLPPKTIELSSVDFSIEERAFYTKLESDSRTQFKAYAAAGTVNQNYANILLMLLRLRQACDHPRLVKDFDSDPVGKDSVEMAKTLPRELLINLFTCLDATVTICHVCNDPPHEPVITMCGHVFCYECVQEYLSGDDNMCPAVNCKETIGDDLVYSKVTLKSCISDDGSTSSSSNSHLSDYSLVQRDDYISSKIKAVLEVLQSNCHMKISNSDLPNSGCCGDSPSSSIDLEFDDSDSEARVAKHTRKYSESTTEGPIKTIVFSQWTSMLDLVETSLCQFGILYRRLDGRMTLGARDKAVRDFNTEPEITVMLMSLKAGNLGLNMVAACHVILLDLWWNPTTEDQAIDRAHRIGQTRPVTVTRITIKDTVEDRILSLQEDKREMVASAFGEDHAGRSGTRLTVDDLKYLFMV
ncbi:helicase-like transcription factor CHR28 [Vigna radiata var. radiata]|uniref:Helicase-like transcription factor CHR28 n=1 Tax=Vigna radiata var. radiata TaxID=3916 RepID=A0A1S3V7W2_VIGRR|nr:helicase-like transcription factor CHR28 [Vigna radiata var. radiata]XP_022641532.1 helicase-like transcription factor CHR28 [Vigna radiata var. radiata]XP_022641533.1 helicase-like transcription factor CHR28 [Vigna radiata var. radiata]XP_022641534.1 helicase-like transcription factor CHR28 [Vigna radiata var. radiata]